MAVATVRPKQNIMKLKRNALARLKLQILFRLFFVSVALVPLVIASYTANLIPLVIGLLIMGFPSILLTFDPEFALGIFNTDRALSCVRYSGHFPKRGLDWWLTGPFSGAKKIAVALVTVLFGWFLNLRSLLRIVFDFQDIYRTVPQTSRQFSAYMKRFCQGLGLLTLLFIIWFAAVNLMAYSMSARVSPGKSNPYVFQDQAQETDKENILDQVRELLHNNAYFYYVEIPFDESGFTLGLEREETTQSASYHAEIAHDVIAPQEIWEFTLSLNEERSKDWTDEADVIHPISYDSGSAATKFYLSKDARGKIMLYYEPRAGAGYVSCAIDEAPQGYQDLLSYLLLPDEVIDMIASDPENFALDGTEGLLHGVYQSQTDRVTIGLKDTTYPFEVMISSETFNLRYETEAIRFDGTHTFTLPN